MMLYKNTKAIVRLPDRENDFFDIVASLARRDVSTIYAYNQVRLISSNVNRSKKRK